MLTSYERVTEQMDSDAYCCIFMGIDPVCNKDWKTVVGMHG